MKHHSKNIFRIPALAALFLSLLLGSCNQVTDMIPISVDQKLGEQVVSQMSVYGNEFKILEREEYPEVYQRLDLIKDRIIQSGQVKHAKDFNWEMKVVDDDSVLNAFCLPGGYIYVFTGLIKFLDSEDQLAGVLGHEIAHADSRHSVKQLAQQMGVSLLIRMVFGYDGSTIVDLASNLLSLSFSRGHETEADASSVKYLYHTPYDARGVMRFFEKLQKDDRNPQVIEFLSTHPDPENRTKDIQEEWEKLGGKKGEKYKAEYEQLKAELP